MFLYCGTDFILMVELTTVGEAIGKFAEALVEKFKTGEKLSSKDHLFLTLYYLSREIELIDKRIDKEVERLDLKIDKNEEEIKNYIDKSIMIQTKELTI